MFNRHYAHAVERQKWRSPRSILGVALPLTALVIGSGLAALSKSPEILSFETGDLTGWRKELCCDYSAVVDTKLPTKDGKHTVKFTLKKNDPDVETSRRAELRLGSVPANSAYTYRFGIFLPTNFISDPSMEIVTQWHSSPDLDLGEEHPSPPLYLKTQKGRWYLGRRWDPNPVTINNTPGSGGGTEMMDLGAYPLNTWTHWKVFVKWSYQADGVIQIWKNGTLIKTIYGPNTYNDVKGPYFKIGIYKPDWKYKPSRSKTTQRILYFDAVRIDSGKT